MHTCDNHRRICRKCVPQASDKQEDESVTVASLADDAAANSDSDSSATKASKADFKTVMGPSWAPKVYNTAPDPDPIVSPLQTPRENGFIDSSDDEARDDKQRSANNNNNNKNNTNNRNDDESVITADTFSTDATSSNPQASRRALALPRGWIEVFDAEEPETLDFGERVLVERLCGLPKVYATIKAKHKRPGFYRVRYDDPEMLDEVISRARIELISRQTFFFDLISGKSAWSPQQAALQPIASNR